MPQRELRQLEQRVDFVREYRRGLCTTTELAERDAISRTTGRRPNRIDQNYSIA
jgi:hypothetical protein